MHFLPVIVCFISQTMEIRDLGGIQFWSYEMLCIERASFLIKTFFKMIGNNFTHHSILPRWFACSASSQTCLK